jgi:hypothetical protein
MRRLAVTRLRGICGLQWLIGHAGLDVLRKYRDQVQEDLQESHRMYGSVDNML